MTRHDEINNEYFEWMTDLVCKNRYSNLISYRKLLTCLHDTEFRYSIPKDENRANDGIDLRWRFVCQIDNDLDHYGDALDYLEGPCSVLEMMVALAIRCEENIMDDPTIGDRTGQWFWGMIVSLGLGSMIDSRFSKRFVNDTIEKFLDREYEPNGEGGLFTIKNCNRDLRTVEIWYQLCWYLDSIV